LVGELEKIAGQYQPKFLRYLQEEEKNFNYELEENAGNERNITQVASLENAGSLCELKLSFEKLTSLKGVENFKNLEEAQFQFNLLSSVESLQSCSKLIQLNIANNRLKSVETLSSLSWLRLLNVEHNLLQNLKPSCRSLEVLIAAHNRIE
jgi:hypothetical protein